MLDVLKTQLRYILQEGRVQDAVMQGDLRNGHRTPALLPVLPDNTDLPTDPDNLVDPRVAVGIDIAVMLRL
ncbi:hypothetical protein D3C80_1562370 [compost metagenome]